MNRLAKRVWVLVIRCVLLNGRIYLSRACLHGRCSYCGCSQGIEGPKKPRECKFCTSQCIHHCHENEEGAAE